MRKIWLFTLFLLAVCACRNDDDDLQRIDQVVHLYMKNSAGQDMLNARLAGSFKNIQLKDIGGRRDQISISGYSFKKDSDTLNFLEYTAGATRNLTDSISPELKHYRSDMILQLQKDAAAAVSQDTLSIFYEWTPKVFEIKSMRYNRQLIFTKTTAGSNAATVIRN